jgi:quercetin dioxygenase-like cupin family protein
MSQPSLMGVPSGENLAAWCGRGYPAGMKRVRALVAIAAISTVVLTGCGSGEEESTAEGTTTQVGGPQVLLDAQRLTVLDQRIRYPKKTPVEISSEIRVLEPGQETGWRRNRVPNYVYVLDGTITMDYDNGVTRDFPAGSAYLEAQGVWHNGTNKGTEPVRLLTVHLGAKGLVNTAERP